MINLPVFPDSTPEGFYERLLASKPLPATSQPDPQKMEAFLARHPETAEAMKIIKQSPPSPGFSDSTFHGLNAFHATNDKALPFPSAGRRSHCKRVSLVYREPRRAGTICSTP